MNKKTQQIGNELSNCHSRHFDRWRLSQTQDMRHNQLRDNKRNHSQQIFVQSSFKTSPLVRVIKIVATP